MNETVYPLMTDTYLFVGRKVTAVLLGNERIEVKTWRSVCAVLLERCSQDPKCRKKLMYMRNRAAGKTRMFLSDKPDGMTYPLKVDNDIYFETDYGSATLMHVLTNRILIPAGFDCSGVSLVLKEKG